MSYDKDKKQAELKFTPGGKAVLNFNLASNDRKKVDDEWVDDTTWYRITLWESLAENFAASIPHGARVFVHGNIRNREYTVEGSDDKRFSLECTGDLAGPELRWAIVDGITRNEKKDGQSGGGSSNKGSSQKSSGGRQQSYSDEEPF